MSQTKLTIKFKKIISVLLNEILRGIEKFATNNLAEKSFIGNYIINDGKYQQLLDTLKKIMKEFLLKMIS